LSFAKLSNIEFAETKTIRVEQPFASISEKEADGAECNNTESECFTIDSRITTPIQPNQEVDGIKFL
jgi:hypothetical protein